MKNKTIHSTSRKCKRPFILLEVLIALALISLFALPLVRAPLETIHEETKALCKLEVERNADLAFAEIKELFYKQAIPWDSFSKERPISYSLSPQTIGTRTFERTAHIYVSYEKEIEGELTLRQLRVMMNFASSGLIENFKYKMVIAR